MRARVLGKLAVVVSMLGCTEPGASTNPEGSTGEAGSGQSSGEGELQVVGESAIVGRELPSELVAELREQDQGRIIVLAPGFIAASRCTDCGAPTYLMFMAVRCTDALHCEVLTEQCEGKISGEAERIDISLAPIEGVEDAACADYSGSFVRDP